MSFLNSVMKPVRSRPFLAMSSALVMVAGMLFGANIATADSVWVQSYERTSQTQACAAQPGETPWQASWGTNSSWSPSWEQWANGGKGGWVCTRSITWARDSTSSTVTYNVGDIGPGGGLVFYIDSGSGLRYEMAPNTWSGASDPTENWCNNTSLDVPGAVGTAVGDGSANTTAIDAACTSGAGQSAADYSANGLSDWFLPSKDELNAMCNYSRNPSAPAAPSDPCDGDSTTAQDVTFTSSSFGFTGSNYWSSSQQNGSSARTQYLDDGSQGGGFKTSTLLVRPIRAF